MGSVTVIAELDVLHISRPEAFSTQMVRCSGVAKLIVATSVAGFGYTLKSVADGLLLAAAIVGLTGGAGAKR